VVRFREKHERKIAFVRARLDPDRRAGLFLTVGLCVALITAWLFGALLQDVLGQDELALFDRPISRFLALHREPALTVAMRIVTNLGGTVFVTVALASATVISYVKTRSPRWPAFLSATLVGAIGLANIVKVLVRRPRPQFLALVHPFGSSFPSGHSVSAAALCGSLAFMVTRRMDWRSGVWVWAGAIFIALLVAISRVYLGAHWPTDVLAGLALGAFWTAITATATRYLGSAAPEG
jgi:undecaprenyl-diphosphatase